MWPHCLLRGGKHWEGRINFLKEALDSMSDKLYWCRKKDVAINSIVSGLLEETLELEYADKLEYYTPLATGGEGAWWFYCDFLSTSLSKKPLDTCQVLLQRKFHFDHNIDLLLFWGVLKSLETLGLCLDTLANYQHPFATLEGLFVNNSSEPPSQSCP